LLRHGYPKQIPADLLALFVAVHKYVAKSSRFHYLIALIVFVKKSPTKLIARGLLVIFRVLLNGVIFSCRLHRKWSVYLHWLTALSFCYV